MLVVFFKMPRVASTTLNLSFSKSVNSISDDNEYRSIHHWNRRTKDRIIYLHNLKKFGEVKIFTFVRNPFFRVVSAYLFAMHSEEGETEYRQGTREVLKQYGSFDSVCKNLEEISTLKYCLHFVPQCYWTHNNDTCLMDYIGKYEDLQSEYRKICSEIGIPYAFEEYRHHSGVWSSEDYMGYYKSERTKEDIRRFYSRDFNLFGYSEQL
jgi:hypothetical protein